MDVTTRDLARHESRVFVYGGSRVEIDFLRVDGFHATFPNITAVTTNNWAHSWRIALRKITSRRLA
jgi:hypothetical protein